MPVPLAQMYAVARYIVAQRLRGRRRYPLVLMLEPLFRCNLACTGCGKIRYPPEILKKQLSVEECLRAADECGAPVVSVAGGEPLLHPDIDRIVRGLTEQGRYVYLCTNGLLLEDKLDLFVPSKRLSFSVHLDGPATEHDAIVGRAGTYERACRAVRAAVARGFRVTTNTTLFNDAEPERVRQFFDEVMRLGVEGMTISPGYAYAGAPGQAQFLSRERTQELFQRVLTAGSRRWKFNQSPLFLEFLCGRRDYDCTPWGNPSYSVLGWQKPCYLLRDGHEPTLSRLLADTDWSRYGPRSGNPACRDCMVHSGFEASAVAHAFSSASGMLAMVRGMICGPAAWSSPRARPRPPKFETSSIS